VVLDAGLDFAALEFDEFYLRTRDRLAVQIAALTGDPVEAVDHVQEAFVRAWTRWSYVSGLEDPEGWVRRVAHNLADETTRSTLRLLSRRPPTSGWQPPDTVRRTAARRRRTKWGTGAAAVLATAVGIAMSLGGGAGTSGTTPPQAVLGGHIRTVAGPNGALQLVANTRPITASDPSALEAVVAAEQRLAFALLNQLGDGSNVTVSPASLYLALGMLQNGARGATADEISNALQADGLSTDDQNAGLAALTAELSAAAEKDGIQLDSANSPWQQQGFEVKQQFLAALAAYYDSGVWQVDYQNQMDDALAAINAWTSENTHGKITKLFDDLDPSTVLTLANAVYLHADWATPFNKAETTDGSFTTADGNAVTAKFMHGGAGLQAAVTSAYQVVQLPYNGGRFTALAIMPTHGSLADFVAGLEPDELRTIASGMQDGVSVAVPRFTTTSTIDLKQALSALGMQQAFTDSADFSALSDTPTAVDQIIQRDYLQVGEYGTTAAAVTGVGMVDTAAPVGPSVSLDHPFLFLIRDTETGAILFASEITDPSS
jgi:serpin B